MTFFSNKCNYLSASIGGRPIDCSGNDFVLLHTVGPRRKERITLHASNIHNSNELEIQIYIGGQTADDVANFRVAAESTMKLFDGDGLVLGKGQSIWALVPANQVNVFGEVAIC